MDALERIGRASLWMQRLAVTLIVIVPAYHVLAWFAVDDWLQTQLAHRGLDVPVADIGATALVSAFAVQTIPVVIAVLLLCGMYRLFACYRRGEVFAPAAIDRFRSMARLLFLFTIVNPLAGAAISLIVTSGQPPGQRMLVIGFGNPEIASLLAGGVLLAIAWVMVEAQRLADDNVQIV